MIALDPASSDPPYEQVRTAVVRQVDDGTLAGGDRLPTVRQLAAALGIAANTVAKAYRELETAGVVSTRGRNGTVVTAAAAGAGGRLNGVRLAADAFVDAARGCGVSLTDAEQMVRTAWGRPGA